MQIAAAMWCEIPRIETLAEVSTAADACDQAEKERLKKATRHEAEREARRKKELRKEAKLMSAQIQQEREDHEALDEQVHKFHEEQEAQLVTQQVFSGEVAATSAPAVIVPTPPAVSRLPSGQDLLQPHDTKKELIPSDFKDDTKTIASYHSQEEDEEEEGDALLGYDGTLGITRILKLNSQILALVTMFTMTKWTHSCSSMNYEF